MSDSDSDPDYSEYSRHRVNVRHGTVIALRPSEAIFDQWLGIDLITRKEAGQRMRVCTFWLPMLLQRDDSSPTATWAIEIGLINHIDSEDISLKQLHKLEIMEAVLRAMERGSNKRDQTKDIISISNMFNLRSPEVLDDALIWLERTGEPDIRYRVMGFGHPINCLTALHLIFTEFAKYIQDMGANLERTLKALMARPSEYLIEKSDEMKKKGNDSFIKQQYQEAVKFYSKAIKYYPDNHFLYGNRALCYIKSEKWLKAVSDGKRATLIKPYWTKGHYRYCEALFSMGEVRMAIEANSWAQSLCKFDYEGVKDLEQQQSKFCIVFSVPKAVPPKTKNKRGSSTNRAEAAPPLQHFTVGLVKNIPQHKVAEVKVEKQKGKSERAVQMKERTKDPKPAKSEVPVKEVKVEPKVEPSTPTKKKSKNRNFKSEKETEKVTDSKAAVCKELKSAVQDAHTALADLRSRNAEQAFSQALALLETTTPKELGLFPVDVLVLLYGRVSALTEIGQSEELSVAQKLMEKMKSFEERKFQCLVFYAMGKVYLKENRFAVAMEQFSDSLQMVKNQITPGKLTWPLTKEIVKETQPEYFKEILEGAIELCRFPPPPDAICRFEKCHSSLKTEIYFTDPDFKGFIQICCCESCTVEYHITCWKTLKTTTFSEKNEKDFLQDVCLTPDCVGQISSIKIYGPTGLVKCKFEAVIPKPQTPKKPKVNQECTSLKKLKSKEERRLKRKAHKQSFQDKQVIKDEIMQKKQDSAAQSQQKAWLMYRDRVLLQISQNMELLRQEKSLQVSALTSSLGPWLELDSSRGNALAQRMLNWQQEESLGTFCQAVELLLERKNRVWARVLLQLLSSCLEINPKLNNWACRLNDAGLTAAKSFIERHCEHLEQLDLTVLLSFDPLQEMIIDRLGTRPEIFSSIGLTMTEYLKQASPHDMRLFIWTLEEHRDDYLSCHTILDEYFDMMDGLCSVLKKSDENQNNSPMKAKSRSRKRKQKGLLSWTGPRAVTPREESDQDLFEDDSLSFLHPGDPFTVPNHLREQVADFEDQYNGGRHRGHYKQILDNNPDPTKESLYDYFAQILEEHGPLVAEDPLLVGELVNFPLVAQQKIQEAGGFESFLLESLRFIKMGRCIGLARHAVTLQQAGHGASLDDLDDIADHPSPDLYECAVSNSLVDSSSTQTEIFPVLPNPYAFSFQPNGGVPVVNKPTYPNWSSGDNPQQQASFFPSANPWAVCNNWSVGDGSGDGRMETCSSVDGAATSTAEENSLSRHTATQTSPESMSSVAVNTELLEPFESCPGDINCKERSNEMLEKQIQLIENGGDEINRKLMKEMLPMREELMNIVFTTRVTNRELAIFQQKLEEEVKKDQKEKKENQEVLKSLKQEIEALAEEQESLARNIREKKSGYEAKFTDFLELGNQSAAEKMSLEDEINRCKTLFSSASRRSLTAQLLVAESNRDQGLFGLYRELNTAKALLAKLDEAVHRFPNQDLEMARNGFRVNVQEIEKKISTAETQYKEQIDQTKNGRRVSDLTPVTVNQSEPPAPLAKEFHPHSSAQASHISPPTLPKPAAAPQLQHKPPPSSGPWGEMAAAEPQLHNKPRNSCWAEPGLEPKFLRSTVFNSAMERLSAIFPDYSRSDLMMLIQELRSSTGGSLSSMGLRDVVEGVTQMILDQQEKMNSVRSNMVGRESPAQCATHSLVNPVPVWQPVVAQRTTHPNAINMEDPCIICHDDMSPDDMCVLECRHSFHKECIKSWLKEQSTCPTCRDHALLPDDFPALGRRRQLP